MTTTIRLGIATAILLVLAPPLAAQAHAAEGTAIENVQLATVDGGHASLLDPAARANLFVFFRTGQERSAEALRALAGLQRTLAGKPIHWVGLVSPSESAAEARAVATGAGFTAQVLVDDGDALYGALGIRLHPMVGFVDGKGRLGAIEMYREIDFAQVIEGRLRLMLGEIDDAAFQRILEPPRGSMPSDDPRDVGRRDVNLGRRLLKDGHLDQALVSARRALERAPMASAFSLIGDVERARGRCAEALKQYAQALVLDPGDRAAAAGRAACAAAPSGAR